MLGLPPDIINLIMSHSGEVVALSMKDGGCIQGRIKSVNANTRTVIIERPFLNGKPMNELEKTFLVKDIISFRILDIKAKLKEEMVTSSGETAKRVPETRSSDFTGVKENKPQLAKISTDSQKTSTARSFVATTTNSDTPTLKTVKHATVPDRGGTSKTERGGATMSFRRRYHPGGNAAIPAFTAVTAPTKVPFQLKQEHHQSPSSSPSESCSSSSVQAKTESKSDGSRGTQPSSNKRFVGSNSDLKSTGSSSRSRRNRGQCGIPELDPTDQNIRVSKNNQSLTEPIDFDLNEDFDFEKNLEIFRNYEENDRRIQERNENNSEQNEMPALEAQFSQLNYEHYENVISDPSRVTSWTTKAFDRFHAVRFEKTLDGLRIPFVKPSDKEKFLQRAEPYLGSDLFHIMIGDRLVMFVWEVINKMKILVNQVVVLDSAAINTFLTTMFLRHISNRSYETVVYSCLLGQYSNLPHVRQVHNVDELPKYAQLIIVIGPLLMEKTKEWIKNLSPPAHLICIEKSLELIENEHVLMFGIGTDSDDLEKRKMNRKAANCLRGIADIGIPFSWMDADSATCLSQAFAMRNIVLF